MAHAAWNRLIEHSLSDLGTGPWIDDFLVYLLREWHAIPALAGEWDQWDEHSQLVFALDWPVTEDRLALLQHWAERDLLTPAQQAQYATLIELVTRHRPTLERLLIERPLP